MKVFVSSQRVDSPMVQSLLHQLDDSHVSYQCSPRNPVDGSDSRWSDWYDDGLPTAIQWADVFVIVIDAAWDSSTWMGQESHVAAGSEIPMYYWNPERIQLCQGLMREYLREPLPDKTTDAVGLLQDRHLD